MGVCVFANGTSKSVYLSTDRHWTIKYAMHAENGRLWRIDDRCTQQRAKHTTVANGESATIHVFHCQVTFLCLQCQHNGMIHQLRDSVNKYILCFLYTRRCTGMGTSYGLQCSIAKVRYSQTLTLTLSVT